MPEIRTVERMGWRPDIPDLLDYQYSDKIQSKMATLPESLRPNPNNDLNLSVDAIIVPKFNKQPVIDQGQAGSCVGCAVNVMHAFERGVAPRSSLQIYYEARRLIGETQMDEGCYIRDAIKVIATLGAGRESWWPYDLKNLFVDPLDKVDRDGLRRKIFNYFRITSKEEAEHCVGTKHPYVTGLTLYTRFMGIRAASSGIIPMPLSDERMVGGHAMTVFGRDPNFRESPWARNLTAAGFPVGSIPQSVRVLRNSWGNWGSNGNLVVDERYEDHPYLSADRWTVRKLAAPAKAI